MRCAILAVAAAFILAGCDSSARDQPEIITPPLTGMLASSVPAAPALAEIRDMAPPPGPESDGVFLVELQRGGMPPDQGQLMIPLAHTTCDALTAGVTREWLIHSGAEQGLNPFTSRLVTDAAIKVYCPEQG